MSVGFLGTVALAGALFPWLGARRGRRMAGQVNAGAEWAGMLFGAGRRTPGGAEPGAPAPAERKA